MHLLSRGAIAESERVWREIFPVSRVRAVRGGAWGRVKSTAKRARGAVRTCLVDSVGGLERADGAHLRLQPLEEVRELGVAASDEDILEKKGE